MCARAIQILTKNQVVIAMLKNIATKRQPNKRQYMNHSELMVPIMLESPDSENPITKHTK